MATKLYCVKGKLRWAKVFPFNKDMNEDYHGPGGAYTVEVLLEPDQMKVFQDTGSRLRPKVTEDGLTVTFKRKHDNPIAPDLGGPPRVVDAEGNDWSGGGDGPSLIGNDSEGEVWFDVYDTKLGKGTRLRAVKVLELVEFEGTSSSENQLPF